MSESGKEEQARLNRLYYAELKQNVSGELLDDLIRKFEPRTMIKRLPDGSIDPYATVAANGAWEVLSYIRQRINLGEKGL